MTKSTEVSDYLRRRYQDAKCALNFSNPFECLLAVVLSAQTSDQAVNLVTPALFMSYPDPFALAKAEPREVASKIKRLGLYKTKAKNLVDLANMIVNQFDNAVPLRKNDLMSLPGVGVKTANVVLAETLGRPAFAVDTHVARIAKRLGFAKNSDEPSTIEARLEKEFSKKDWIDLHHRFIAFGRDLCRAKNPHCEECELRETCLYFKKKSSTTAK